MEHVNHVTELTPGDSLDLSIKCRDDICNKEFLTLCILLSGHIPVYTQKYTVLDFIRFLFSFNQKVMKNAQLIPKGLVCNKKGSVMNQRLL